MVQNNNMTLLVVSERISEHDDDIAFHVLWVKELIRQGFDVEVICLERGVFDGSFSVHSLGKEKGIGGLRRVVRFLHLITKLKYDSVLVLMNPEYVTLGSWWWLLTRKPVYLWYTHYAVHVHIRLAALVCRRLFAATAQSMPQLEGNPKKVVLGHGIDVNHWLQAESARKKVSGRTKLVSIHRIARSKRVEVSIRTLEYLPSEYTLDIYGPVLEPEYQMELKQLVQDRGLAGRVAFYGPVPMDELRSVYPRYRLLLNMASETIDKTMVEAMLFGVYPVTTPGNSRAIGLPVWPEAETSEALANFILHGSWDTYTEEELKHVVEERHSLVRLMHEIGQYIKEAR